MPSSREMRLRIRSIKNLAQVTKALETVSASKVRRAIQSVTATKPYAQKAWQVLVHLADQPTHKNLHPLLVEKPTVNNKLVLVITSDRGLAGALNVNVLRNTLVHFKENSESIKYVAVGRKGRDLLLRSGCQVIADFSGLPSPPTFVDVSAIGRLLVDDYLAGGADQVYISYTNFVSMSRQVPVIRKLLPLDVTATEAESGFEVEHLKTNAVFIYEPDQKELLDEIVPRFTALQVFQAILSAQASEHAARMMAMHNASENASDLVGALQLEYNKMRQQMITSEMLDISGGAEALAQMIKE
ncbi:MAG TPA: ATP synthase F1 subunit gamma [Anaerolineaceae bacterium]